MSKLSLVYHRSHAPIYVQLASIMRQRIVLGEWRNGSKITTLEELEREFGVARITIRQAIELLQNEGLLDVRQGRGTFVSGMPKQNRWLNLANDIKSMIVSVKYNVVETVFIENNAQSPDLAAGEGALSTGYTFLRSVQYNEGEPFSVVNLHLARDIFEKDRKRFIRSAALPIVFEKSEVRIVHAYQTLTVGVADPQTAGLLKIGLGEPTADCRLVLVNHMGIAVYVADIHYHKNCFALRIDLLDRKRDAATSANRPLLR